MLRIIPVFFLCLIVLVGIPVYGEEPAASASGSPSEAPGAVPDASSAPAAPPSGPPAEAPAASPAASSVHAAPVKNPDSSVEVAPSDSRTQVKETLKKPAATVTPAVVEDNSPARREHALKTWQFLKENGKDTREEMTETVLFQLVEFRRLNPDWDFSDKALPLISELRMRKGDYKGAIVDLLALIYEYPNSRLVIPAKSTLAEIIQKKLEKKYKPILIEASKGSDAKEKSDRLAQLLKKLVEQTDDVLYEPIVAQFDDFFYRFPAYAGADELNVTFGDLERKKEKFLSALTYYRKVLALYPESQFRPRAQKSIGDVYVNNLKDINAADNAFQEVINQYPNSEEAAYAYEQMAKLEEQLKHYDLSVELNEKIIQRYPSKDIALRAFNNEARILRDSLERPDDAIRAYGRLADMFTGSAGAAEALKAAAVIARKQKNYDLEIALYVRFANECSANKAAPELYYQAAQVAEDDLLRPDQAIELYGKVVEKFPGNSFSKKAQGRIDKLMKKK